MNYCSIIQPLSHHPSHLELHAALGGDLDFLQCLRILCCSGLPSSWFKYTKVPEFQAIVLPKLGGYLIKQVLDHGLDRYALALGFVRNPVYQVFL